MGRARGVRRLGPALSLAALTPPTDCGTVAGRMITTLFPRTSYRAIEERYATWQSRLALTRYSSAVYDVDLDAPAAQLANLVHTPFVLIVTNTLLVPPLKEGVDQMVQALERAENARAALPVANEASSADQHRPSSEIYLTLRQFEEIARTYLAAPEALMTSTWRADDPGMFLVRSEALAADLPLRNLIRDREVVIVPQAFYHRYAGHRSQARMDLLELIDPTAASILEFGCGEAALGLALKQRQSCRVVGIELDEQAAAVARERIDHVYSEDVRAVIPKLDEQFDWIVGGDILEHIEDPWTFLAILRGAVKPGGRLLLSLPNISSWPIIADLLQGRFDYVYMGILCAGHVRFFTKSNIREMLAISGWGNVELRDQFPFPSPEYDRLAGALRSAAIPFSEEDLLPTGHYVIATNDAGENE